VVGVTGRRSADRSSASERRANLVGVTNVVATLSHIAPPSWTGNQARDALLVNCPAWFKQSAIIYYCPRHSDEIGII
jgi:hypothetical protein